jgi:hypothetical protein
METNTKRRYLTKGDLATRYGVVTRTIDRWLAAGLFPVADLILPNGAPRWSEGLVETTERASVGQKAS